MRDIKNRLFFKLRNTLQLSRKIYHPPFEVKEDKRGSACGRFEELFTTYALAPLEQKFTQNLFDIQLYHLDLLDQFLTPFICESETLTLFDHGCDNWHYLPAIWHWAQHFSEQVQIDGMEIDPWRMYVNAHTKKSFAQGICKGYKGAQYIRGDSLHYSKQVDVVLSLLPFIEHREMRAWGLPKRFFKPLVYLKHLWDILNPGGVLLLVNVDKDECVQQKKLCDTLGIKLEIAGEAFESILCEYPSIRRVSVACKPL